MISKRDKSSPVKDYGVKSNNTMIVILGISSIFLGIIWALIPIFWYSNNQKIVFYYSIIYSEDTGLHPVSIVGLLLMIIGILAQCWARLLRGSTAAAWGLNKRYKLITNGPYQVIRHPNYLMYYLLLVGLFLSTFLWPVLLTTPLMIGYIKLIPYEEELLVKHFGKEYIDYQNHTWKLIPFIF